MEIVRTALVATALRDAGEGSDSLGLMDVRFSPFNTWYRVDSYWEGTFLERSVPGAFKRTIDAHNSASRVDAHNIKTLFNHGMDFNVGDKLLGDIVDLAEEQDSPRSTVSLWDTSYNRDLLPGLRSGAYGSSFMFRVVQDEWNNEPDKTDHNPDGIPERTLKEVRVFEAGPVTWPANPHATAGMRCMSVTDSYYEHLSRREPERVAELRSRLTALRAHGPAKSRPADPPKRHSGAFQHARRREQLYPYLKG